MEGRSVKKLLVIFLLVPCPALAADLSGFAYVAQYQRSCIFGQILISYGSLWVGAGIPYDTILPPTGVYPKYGKRYPY